jgi:hypothetical protein
VTHPFVVPFVQLACLAAAALCMFLQNQIPKRWRGVVTVIGIMLCFGTAIVGAFL